MLAGGGGLLSGGRNFFGRGAGVSGDVRDLLDRLVDPGDARADVLDAAAEPVEGLPGLGRGLRSALGELAYFFGDDGEPAALLAGAGGFDRGVELRARDVRARADGPYAPTSKGQAQRARVGRRRLARVGPPPPERSSRLNAR